MAVVPFVFQESLVNGVVFLSGPLGSGDSTGVHTINEGDSDVSAHVYGTFGGATVAMVGSLVDGQFGKIDDAFGVEMSYTAEPGVKPVGPALQSIKGVVTGGVGVTVFVAVYVVRRGR